MQATTKAPKTRKKTHSARWSREHSMGVRAPLSTLVNLRYAADKIDLMSFLKAKTTLLGNQFSPIRGRGIDFSEVRAYQEGDDIRHMDWRVTARTGKPHTKLFQEERERPVFFLVDYSPSMFFGTRVAFKSVIAAQTAAALAWATIRHGDRVGGIIFSGMQTTELQPHAKIRGVLNLLKPLADISKPPIEQPQPGGLANALMRLRRIIRPGSMLFIISDFASLNVGAEQQLSYLQQYNDIIAINIFDPLEQQPPPDDRYAISDGEQLAVIDTRSKEVHKKYCALFVQHEEYLKSTLQQRRIPLLTLQTNDNVVEKLQQYLAQLNKHHKQRGVVK